MPAKAGTQKALSRSKISNLNEYGWQETQHGVRRSPLPCFPMGLRVNHCRPVLDFGTNLRVQRLHLPAPFRIPFRKSSRDTFTERKRGIHTHEMDRVHLVRRFVLQDHSGRCISRASEIPHCPSRSSSLRRMISSPQAHSTNMRFVSRSLASCRTSSRHLLFENVASRTTECPFFNSS